MVFLSIALILIFVMWIIDKHNAWKGAAKVALGLAALSILGLGCFYGWGKYEDWRTEKAEAAAKAKHEAAVKACMTRNGVDIGGKIARSTPDPYAQYGGSIDLHATCEANPDFIDLSAGLVPKKALQKSSEQIVLRPPDSDVVDGYVVGGIVCWKDRQGKLNYPHSRVIPGEEEPVGQPYSLDGKPLEERCPSLKAGEGLTWPRDVL